MSKSQTILRLDYLYLQTGEHKTEHIFLHLPIGHILGQYLLHNPASETSKNRERLAISSNPLKVVILINFLPAFLSYFSTDLYICYICLLC